jgi:hypothetical protein
MVQGREIDSVWRRALLLTQGGWEESLEFSGEDEGGDVEHCQALDRRTMGERMLRWREGVYI